METNVDTLNLGSIALLKSHGNPSHALADLMSNVVVMAGFINTTFNKPADLVLEAWDDMVKTSREELVKILEEEK